MKRSGFHNFSRDQLACVEIEWCLLCCLWRNSREPVGGSTGQYNFLLGKTFVLICPETENCGKISSLPQNVAGQTRKMKTKSRVNNEKRMSKKTKHWHFFCLNEYCCFICIVALKKPTWITVYFSLAVITPSSQQRSVFLYFSASKLHLRNSIAPARLSWLAALF